MEIKIYIFAFIILEIICRFILSKQKSNKTLQFLLLSGIIQSLMIYPVIGSFLAIAERGLDYMGAPFERVAGILFPSILVLPLVTSGPKRKWSFKEIKYPTIVICVVLVYSLLTPINCSLKATFIVCVLFLQMLFVIMMCKTSINAQQYIKALHDGLMIIIIVELLISVAYSILWIDSVQNLFVPELDDIETMREGTHIRRAFGTTGQPNRLGGLGAYIFVFYTSCFIFSYKKTKSFWGAVFSFCVILLSQSRSALLASVIAGVILVFLYYYKMGKLKLSYIFVGLLLFTTFIFILINTNFVNDMLFNSNVSEMEEARVNHYILGWAALQKSNYIGVGLNSHVYYLYNEINTYGFNSFFYTRAIHSIHLCILVETGIWGFLLWVYYLYSRFYKIVATPVYLMNIPILWFSFLGMLVVIIVHGFSDNLYLHYQYLMILMLTGAYCMREKVKKNKLRQCSIYNRER